MDAKEAIDYFKGILFIQNSGETVILPSSSIKAKVANALAISALEKVETFEAENARLREKETPKIPLKKDLSHYEDGSLCIHFEQYCPVCKHLVESVYDYCGFCGQAIRML